MTKPLFQCQECGRTFRTAKAAARAAFADNGCPGCGGVDIDVYDPDARFPAAEDHERDNRQMERGPKYTE